MTAQPVAQKPVLLAPPWHLSMAYLAQRGMSLAIEQSPGLALCQPNSRYQLLLGHMCRLTRLVPQPDATQAGSVLQMLFLYWLLCQLVTWLRFQHWLADTLKRVTTPS